ncbi:MAG: hypothetical protein NVSMB69_18230 [Novosphingobium sp.]
MIRVALGGVVAMGAVGSVYLFGFRPPPDEFALSRAQVYERLAAAPLHGKKDGVFGGIPVDVHGNGFGELHWDAGGQACTLGLARLSDASTRVAVFCKGIDSLSAEHLRDRVIEQVDATLTGRPFDPRKADGATSYRWPAQPVALAQSAQPAQLPTRPAGMVNAGDSDAGPPLPADPADAHEQ